MLTNRMSRSWAALPLTWCRVVAATLVATTLAAAAASVAAHEGPPFPILMDEPLAGYTISVWADPDIGEAEFFIVVESSDRNAMRNPPQVSMWVEPVNQRLARVEYQATRQPMKNQMQFRAEPHFDQQDMWTVGFRLETALGPTNDLTTEIESTPDGYGAWDVLIYLFPFVFLGGMWLVALVRRRSHCSTHPSASTAPQSDNGQEAGAIRQRRAQAR